jgi:peptidoglycan/LPS O-acetylase OafA/YrhL
MSHTPARLPQLDALRGLAALVVLLHHAWLLLPRSPEDGLQGLDMLLEGTPLRVLALGRPAVIFFFVLSGYVLVRACMERPVPWPVFAAQRAARLGPPVLASVLLSFALWSLAAGEALPEILPDFAHATWAGEITPAAALRQGLLLNTDPDNGLNPVLWSLVHEWRIGLLLPLALLFRGRPDALVAIGLVCFAATVLAGVPLNTAFIGPDIPGSFLWSTYFVLPFAAGGALALAGPLRRLGPLERRLAGLLVLVAMLGSRHDLASVAGSAALIALVVQRDGAPAWLVSPVPCWLGTVSFSLYLVHLPLMTGLLHLLAGHVDAWAVIALSLPASLGLAALFHAAVERPSQRLARSLAPRDERATRETRGRSSAPTPAARAPERPRGSRA